MKEFRKDQNGNFICEECNLICKSINGVVHHIIKTHKLLAKEYYDKWLKEDGEGLCKICGKETTFISISKRYKSGCCKKHINLYAYEQYKITLMKHLGVENVFQLESTKQKARQTCLKHFGVEFPMQSNEVKEKSKQSCLEIYGVEYTFQSEEIKNKSKKTMIDKYNVLYPAQSPEIFEKNKKTNKERYGVEYTFQSKEIYEKGKKTKKEKYDDENYNNRKQCKETCIKKYGVDQVLKSKNVRNKGKQTCLIKYGVEYPSQNPDIHLKQQKSGKKIHYFNGIKYRGLFELDFLEKYYLKYPDIINPNRIEYFFNGKKHYYFPDFYIPSLNLIIEIKNSYNARVNKKKIRAKKKAVLDSGYKFIMIIDKKYPKFL